MISKMKQNKEGSRLAIVFNGSPLFSGGAGSGPSEIRKWIIENDMLETIIAMPDQLFYNTGIATYIWIVTKRKEKKRKGKVQLINASGSDWENGDPSTGLRAGKDNPFYVKMMRSLGNKRKEIGDAKNGKPDQIKTITEIYEAFEESEYCKIFDNDDFGYTRITVDRPKRNEKGEVETDKKGEPIADSDLRDYENIPLKEDIEEYFKREVLPHLPDAWIDHSKTKIGYEINFTKYFYKYKPLRSLEDIRKDILKLEEETLESIKEIIE
jgi:type I restriction enzyme M protein